MRLGLRVAVLGVVLAGCNECREIETFYRGARSGTLVVMDTGPAGFSLSIRPDLTGPWDDRTAFSGRTTCTSGRAMAVPGQQAIAWLSPDDLATVTARCDLPDGGTAFERTGTCAPADGDPRAEKTFTVATAGTTLIQLELLDP